MEPDFYGELTPTDSSEYGGGHHDEYIPETVIDLICKLMEIMNDAESVTER